MVQRRDLTKENPKFELKIYRDGSFDAEMTDFIAVGLTPEGGVLSSAHLDYDGVSARQIIADAEKLISELKQQK